VADRTNQGVIQRGPIAPNNPPELRNGADLCAPRRNGDPVASWPKGNTSQVRGLPGQSWHGSHVQWNSGKNDGFVRDCQSLLSEMAAPLPDPGISMTYWREDELPFYHALASRPRTAT
jgi:phospholipase C